VPIGFGRVQGGHSRAYSIFDNEKNMSAAGQEDTFEVLNKGISYAGCGWS
jgi:hypothetical protein